MLCGKISSVVDSVWTSTAKMLFFTSRWHRSRHIILLFDSVYFHALCLFFRDKKSSGRSVLQSASLIYSFSQKKHSGVVGRSSGRHSTRRMLLLRDWCFRFCFIFSPRRWRLVAKRWSHCRLYPTLCMPSGWDAGMWLHTSCIRYHGYKDSCGWWRLLSQMVWVYWKVSFQQQLLLHYWMSRINHDGRWGMHTHWACSKALGSTLCHVFLLA